MLLRSASACFLVLTTLSLDQTPRSTSENPKRDLCYYYDTGRLPAAVDHGGLRCTRLPFTPQKMFGGRGRSQTTGFRKKKTTTTAPSPPFTISISTVSPLRRTSADANEDDIIQSSQRISIPYSHSASCQCSHLICMGQQCTLFLLESSTSSNNVHCVSVEFCCRSVEGRSSTYSFEEESASCNSRLQA